MLERQTFQYPPLSIAVPTPRSLLPVVFEKSASIDVLIHQASRRIDTAFSRGSKNNPPSCGFRSPSYGRVPGGCGGSAIISAAKEALDQAIECFTPCDVQMLLDVINAHPRLDDSPGRRAAQAVVRNVAISDTNSVVSMSSISTTSASTAVVDTPTVNSQPLSPYARQDRQRYEANWKALDPFGSDDRKLFSDLQDKYETIVGMRFVTDPQNYTLKQIICQLERRLDAFEKGTGDKLVTEFKAAISAIDSIARHRWNEMEKTLVVPK